jgi:uncharacterized cofD-like protein
MLVGGIAAAIGESRAVRVYVCNIMTQPGETDGFSVEDHLRVLLEYAPALAIDFVVLNIAPISASLREKYLAEGSVEVMMENEAELLLPRISRQPRVLSGDLLSQHDVVRHDPAKLAAMLVNVAESVRTPV